MLKFYLFFESKISLILFSFVFFLFFYLGRGWEGIIFYLHNFYISEVNFFFNIKEEQNPLSDEFLREF
jgi:hypothetical protein